jgi:hypothetical protein
MKGDQSQNFLGAADHLDYFNPLTTTQSKKYLNLLLCLKAATHRQALIEFYFNAN